MSWLKLDDAILRHPKFVRAISASPHALHMWLGMLSWCKQQLSDGLIPTELVSVVDGPRGKARTIAIRALCDAELVHTLPGGALQMHDYLDWNLSAAEVKAKRALDAARKKDPSPKPGPTGRILEESGKNPERILAESAENLGLIQNGTSTDSISCAPIPNGVQPSESESESEILKKNTSSSAPAAPSSDNPPASAPDEAARVFAAWRAKLEHPRAKFDNKRIRLVRARLQQFSVDELLKAVDGCARSDWHTGRHPKTEGKRYDEFERIFQGAASVEKFIEIAERAPGDVTPVGEEQWL